MNEIIQEFIENSIIIYILVTFVITFTYCVASFFSFNKNRVFQLFHSTRQDDIPVSLLVPAYNEEKTICNTIDSLLNLNYRHYEIVVINDGSVDGTLSVIKEKYGLKKIYKPMRKQIETKEIRSVYQGVVNEINLIVIDKINGGKADTLNVGINYSNYPLFVSIDADSILEINSLQNIIAPFMENSKTIAVGGNIRIANNVVIQNGKVVERLDIKQAIVAHQICEYTRTFLTHRMSWNLINMNLIISGAFGAFNKKVVIEVGGYKTNTIGEDMELVMRLHKKFLSEKKEYYIKFSPNAYCYTQAPETLKGLKTQRRRWHTGLIQSLITHKEMFLSWNWFLAKVYYILFEFLTPIIEVLGLLFVVMGLLFNNLDIYYVVKIFAIIIIYNFIVCISSLLLEIYSFKEKINYRILFKQILFALVENIGYRQLLTLYRLSAFIKYKKSKHQWGYIPRTKQNEIMIQKKTTLVQ